MQMLLPIVALFVFALTSSVHADSSTKLLCSFPPTPASAAAKLLHPEAAELSDDGLTLTAGDHNAASVVIAPAEKVWNAEGFTRLLVDIENLSDAPTRVWMRASNSDATDWSRSAVAESWLAAKQRSAIVLYFYRDEKDATKFPDLSAFKGMNGLPGGFQTQWPEFDPAAIENVVVSLPNDGGPRKLRVRSIVAAEPVVPKLLQDEPAKFFPFIDAFGQYRWADWPTKTHSVEEMKAATAKELASLAETSETKLRLDRFGGWITGPALAKSKFFRTEKIDGRWWLVDPDGHLFWSHGANCVGFHFAETKVGVREKYFADLPAEHDEYAFAWSGPADARKFDHLIANLYRVFGKAWKERIVELTLARMHGWGLNTIGAWSDDAVMAARKVPYTKIIHPGGPYARPRIPDAFEPIFLDAMKTAIAKAAGDAIGDPWCVGLFVENELLWGNSGEDFTAMIFGAPPNKAMKLELIRRLRAEFVSIDALNAKIGTKYESWDGLNASTKTVKPAALTPIAALASTFTRDATEQYYRLVAEAVRTVAPGQLYLGSRINGRGRESIESSAKYCDVVSLNRYDHSVAGLDAPGARGIDKPILITEFHFGALDRGYFATGLKPASSQKDRAMKYAAYVRGAIAHPNIVGTHWFSFAPESVAGRFDGENFDVGLTDVCNRPREELTAAMNDVASDLYQRRMNAPAKR